MPSYNKVILIGHLGKDPEMRYTPSGAQVVNFSLATSRRYKDKNGQQQERTEWHNIIVWGKSAENCMKYIGSGSLVQVEGEISSRSYRDKADIDRKVTEIRAERVLFLDHKKSLDNASAPENLPDDDF